MNDAVIVMAKLTRIGRISSQLSTLEPESLLALLLRHILFLRRGSARKQE